MKNTSEYQKSFREQCACSGCEVRLCEDGQDCGRLSSAGTMVF